MSLLLFLLHCFIFPVNYNIGKKNLVDLDIAFVSKLLYVLKTPALYICYYYLNFSTILFIGE